MTVNYKGWAKFKKIEVARRAKQEGIINVANELDIPMHVVRAWVGTYMRVKSKAQDNGHTAVTLQLPPWSNGWDPSVQKAWLELADKIIARTNTKYEVNAN